MSNKERTIWNVYAVRGGGYVLRDAAEPALLVTDLLWFVGRTPAFMTKDEAFAWVRALANLGQAPALERKTSAWLPCNERPTPADSPVLLRGRTPGAPPSLLAWHDGYKRSEWEGLLFTEQARTDYERACAPHWFIPAPDTGPYGGQESFAEFTADELAELMETHEIEWMPQRQSAADNSAVSEPGPTTSSAWRTDVPLAADSPILARLTARRRRFFVMHWDMEWETSGPVDDDGVVYTHTEIADMVADGVIEWRPLDLDGDA